MLNISPLDSGTLDSGKLESGTLESGTLDMVLKLDLTLRMRKVRELSIRIWKVRDLSHYDEKGITIIYDRLNGSLFRDIYIFSTFTRFPYFTIL